MRFTSSQIVFVIARVENGVVRFRGIALALGTNFAEVNPIEGPAMRLGDGAELVRRLRQCDVERPFAPPRAFEQELEGERRLSRSGVALDQIEAATGEPPGQNVVEARYAHGNF
jgi:hypothetical protein